MLRNNKNRHVETSYWQLNIGSGVPSLEGKQKKNYLRQYENNTGKEL